MRIAVGGVRHETNTFSTLRTSLADFRVQRGDEVVAAPFWRTPGVDLVGTISASAPPHGLVRRDAYEALKAELLERLRAALPLDGVLLDLHGAMEVEDGSTWSDGESDLAAAVRALVGPYVPIAVPLDLHGNLAPALIASVDVLTALRTAPHRDGEPTRRRALDHLVRAIGRGHRPVTAMVKPPLLIPGEWAVTEAEPALSLYGLLPELERRPGVWDASVMIGCAWTDSPNTSTAALVVADDAESARREARWLAERIWEQRAAFGPDVETAPLDEAIDRALGAPESTVYLSDSGDNVTAGGAGDLPIVLERLLAAGATNALVGGLADASAVGACHAAGVGARLRLSLGGKLDAVNGRALDVEAAVLRLAPELALVQSDGVRVILAADRRAFIQFADFAAVGLDPLDHKVVVVKQGYLFPELRDRAPRAIMALSPGFTDLRLDALPFRRVGRPIFPLDPDTTWEPT